jgi:hypothetical protein
MRSSARFTSLVLIAAALVALAFAGCGKQSKPSEAKEGGRVYVGNLFYQVQLSRQLNPKDVEDGYYLTGQPEPKPGTSYFGVFMRVDNEDSTARVTPLPITAIKIVDAKGNEFHPIAVSPNGWNYQPVPLGKGAHLPIPDTPADIGPIRGSLILFKIPLGDLDSRPLELELKGATGKSATITLDV